MMELTQSLTVQLISCTIACVGFAMWFHVKGWQVVGVGLGAFFTWLVYALLFERWDSNFLATLAGAIFVAAFAQIFARINRAPATIFLTAAVFPLVPGPNLYYTMYCLVMKDYAMARSEAVTLLLTCLGIALGFIVVEIFNKYITLFVKHWRIKRGLEKPDKIVQLR